MTATTPDKATPELRRPSRSRMNHLIRLLAWAVLGGCLVLAGLFLAFQVPQVRDAFTAVITRTLTDAVARHTQARCRIEGLGGNLVSGFTLKNISLTEADNGKTLLTADEVGVSYLLPLLMQKKLWLRRLSVSGLKLTLAQRPDGSWNLSALSPKTAAEAPEPRPEDRSVGFPEFKIRLGRLSIRDSQVRIVTGSDAEKTERDISGIECRGRIRANLGRKNNLSASIDHFSAAMNLPRITVNRFSGDIRYDLDTNRFEFRDAAIVGEKCDFTINGLLAILEDAPDRTVLDRIVMDLQANVPAMCLGEFGRAFPIDMPYTDVVSGNLAVKGPVSAMDCRVDLSMDQCHVVSQGLVTIDGEYRVGLDLKGRISGLDLARLPALPLDFLPGDLSTDGFTLDWQRIGMPDQKGRISLHLTPSVLLGYPIDEADITTDISGPDMRFKSLAIRTPHGELKGDLDLIGIMSGQTDKDIRIDAAIAGLDPAGWLQDDTYASDISGDLKASLRVPKTWDADDIDAEARCRLNPSTFMGVNIRRADLEGAWAGRVATLRRLDVNTPFGSASLTGKADLKDRALRLKAGVDIPDLARAGSGVTGLAKAAGLSGKASMTADISGTVEHPEIAAALSGADIAYNGLTADTLAAGIRWRGGLSDFSGTVEAGLTKVRTGGVSAPALDLAADLSPALLQADLDLDAGPDARMHLSGQVRDWLKPDKTIEITDVQISALDQPPLVNQEPVIIRLTPNAVIVSALHLVSGPAVLQFSGQAGLTPKAKAEGLLSLRDLDISRLSGQLSGAERLRGRISSDARISGTMEKPVIQMNLALQEAAFDQYTVSEASAAISHAGDRTRLKASVSRNGARLMAADGSAQVFLSLLPFAFQPGPEGLSLRLKVDDADIAWVSDLIDHPEYGFTGRLSADAGVYGDFSAPRLEGNLYLTDGTLNLKKQGLTYEDFTAAVRFDKDVIAVDEATITGDKEGRVQLSGRVAHDRFVPRDFNFHAVGKEVFVPFRGGVQAWVNPDLTLSGDRAHPKVEGRIRVARCRVNLDRFLQDQPAEIKIINTTAAENGRMEIPDNETEGLSMFDPLLADVRVGISRDCWLRGKDAQFEIKGNVQLKKDPEKPFVLFGELNAVRGTYRFRGKLFQITEGALVFVGQEDLNPPVNIEARTEVDDAVILIRLTGTFQHLNLTFDSDPPMDQAEIISYILFGRSPEALSEEEAFKAEEMALSFTGQMAADKLRDIVGDALGIDYLNISTGGSDLRQGSLSMGKYILPKVFVVFRQGFSEKNTQQFEVSYEINRYFDIQSQIDNEQTSALDLIWKYEF